MLERCGQPDKRGEPCTMKRGHRATWHRARPSQRIDWRIRAYGGPGSRQAPQLAHGDRALDLYRELRKIVATGGSVVLEVER